MASPFQTNPANAVAMAGCIGQADAHGFDWSTFYLISGIIWIFYGVTLWCSPFQKLPTTGRWKYAWLGFESAIKESAGDAERNYDLWTTGMCQFNGCAMLIHGLVNLWASNVSGDFTFFHVVVIGFALQFVTFLKTLVENFSKWNKLVYCWGVMFLVCLVLAIVVLAAHSTDLTQLVKVAAEADGGIEAGGILWFYFVFSLVGGVQLIVTSFDRFSKFGPAFYMKDAAVVPAEGAEAPSSYTLTKTGKAIQRLSGTLNVMLSLVFLWAAMNFAEEGSSDGPDFSFPMTQWIGNLFFICWMGYSYLSEEDHWEPFAVMQSTLILASLTAVALAGWQMSCQ